MVSTFLEWDFNTSTTSLTAILIPCWISVDLRPFEIHFKPSSAIADAIIQVAVVPSPASLFVFSEAWTINFAPSPSASIKVIDFATVTPSLVTFAVPVILVS